MRTRAFQSLNIIDSNGIVTTAGTNFYCAGFNTIDLNEVFAITAEYRNLSSKQIVIQYKRRLIDMTAQLKSRALHIGEVQLIGLIAEMQAIPGFRILNSIETDSSHCSGGSGDVDVCRGNKGDRQQVFDYLRATLRIDNR